VGRVCERPEGRRHHAARRGRDAEDLTDKSAVTPGPLAPARELYGFMLLESGRSKDALAAFEAVTKKEPNRFLALYGAGKARRRETAGEGEGLLPAGRQDLRRCRAGSSRTRVRAEDGEVVSESGRLLFLAQRQHRINTARALRGNQSRRRRHDVSSNTVEVAMNGSRA